MRFKAVQFDFEVFDVTLFSFAEGSLPEGKLSRVWSMKARKEREREMRGGRGVESERQTERKRELKEKEIHRTLLGFALSVGFGLG